MQDISLFIQNHPTLFMILLGLALLAAIVEYIRLRRQAASVNPATAVLLMNREQATVVDIRSKEAWQAGHITGALSAPLTELAQLNKKIAKLGAHPVIIVCATGTDSRKAADHFQKSGLDSRILAGGMNAWLAAGLPIIGNN